jgi:hypothetical protein
MVVNFRGKDLNAAGLRVSNTKITATPDEINQAIDGISAEVTAANLSELTGGAETDLHSHAASGGGSGGLVSVDVPISEAELKNLHVVSKTLLSAQGAGTVVEPIQITVERLTGTAYTVPGGNYFEFGWPDGVAGQSLVAFDPTRLLGSFSSGARGFVQLAPSVGSNYWANPDTVVNTFDDKANQPFGVALDSAVTDGTGGLIMHVLYRVL